MAVKEIVLFRLRSDAIERFDTLSSTMGAFLATRKGFISRTVLKDVNDPALMIDLVEWGTLEDAVGSAKAAEEEASVLPFVQAIETIISMSHYTVVGSTTQ
jgi:hypothetical protein